MSELSGQEVPPEDLPDSSSRSGQPVPSEDMPESLSGQEVPVSDLPDEDLQNQYGTPLQQVGATAEGFARGIAPGLATAAENKLSELGVPGISPQEQLGRQLANPAESGAGEVGGNIALMTALPEAEFAKLGQVGSKAINGMIHMGLISGGDEVSKSLLGQGDPASAVAAHIAGSSALGLLGGGVFGKAEELVGKGLKALEAAKVGDKLKGLVAGFGHAASFPENSKVLSLGQSALTSSEKGGLDPVAFKAGQKMFGDITGSAGKNALTTGSSVIGYHVAGPYGGLAAPVIEKGLEKILAPVASKASQKYIGPAVLRAAASGNLSDLSKILDHATMCAKGIKRLSGSVENLFSSSGNKVIDHYSTQKDDDKLDNFIQDGGIDPEIKQESQDQGIPQQYAQGGSVQPSPQQNPMETVFPEQHILLTSAKGRISNYLNSLKPSKITQKLPYDTDHKDPKKEKDYKSAINLANQPLTILNKVKDGSLLPKDVTNLTSMYPELHKDLSDRIVKRMSEGQLKDEKKPPYKTRQAMSLFLGSSLDSTLTPQSMMAAQNVFAQQKSAQPQPASKGAIKDMGKSSQTVEQGREARANKS